MEREESATRRRTDCSPSSTDASPARPQEPDSLLRRLALPPAVQRPVQGVIDAANRANVSIYTMMRRPAGGERAGENPRPGEQGRVERRRILGGGKTARRAEQSLENNWRTCLRQDRATSLQRSGPRHRRASPSHSTTTCVRPSSASRASAQLLPVGYSRAREVRRQVPQHRGEGEPAWA